MAFFILSAAVFWGTAAGVTFQSCPYRVFNCGDANPGITFAGTKWGQEIFFRQCSRIVAIQGLAWAECAFFPLTSCLMGSFDVSTRRGSPYFHVLRNDSPHFPILCQAPHLVLWSHGIASRFSVFASSLHNPYRYALPSYLIPRSPHDSCSMASLHVHRITICFSCSCLVGNHLFLLASTNDQTLSDFDHMYLCCRGMCYGVCTILICTGFLVFFYPL